MRPRSRRWSLWTVATSVLGLGGSAVIAPQAVLVLAWGLVGLGLIIVLALLMLLFCREPFERFLRLVTIVLREPPRAT